MSSSDDDVDEAILLCEGGGHSKSRRAKARAKARRGAPAAALPPPPPAPSLPPGVILEYEAAPVEGALGAFVGACAGDDPALAGVLAAFRRAAGVEEGEGGGAGGGDGGAGAGGGEEEAEEGGGGAGEDGLGGAAAHLPGGLTRKQRRALLQDFVTEIKSRVARPDVVEAHDVTSHDPALLVHLKALRNSVPAPRHWCHLKRYLQGKRGLPRPAYQLPEYVAATGIGTLRDMDNEAAEKKSLKGKTRDRARPKMGRIEIDYQQLHDAFFVHQTKPPMTAFGELYYEGKEFEKDRSAFAPGVLSDRLREALGMPPRASEEGGGGSAPPAPPPWLTNMQRYGPPPSYAGLPIPGLSAPLPAGAAYGHAPGQWGRPPTDQFGYPLYGDVFGVGGGAGAGGVGGGGAGGGVHWGEPGSGWVSGSGAGGAGAAAARAAKEAAAALEAALAPPEAPAAEAPAPAPTPAPHPAEALATGGTDTSMSAAGGGVVELRKTFAPPAQPPPPQQLYSVLPERATALSGGLLGTRAVYDLGGGGSAAVGAAEEGGGGGGGGGARRGGKEVAVAIAPEELAKLSEVELARKFDEETARAAAAAAAAGGDVSDLLEEQARKQKRKLAAKEDGEGGGKKRKKGDSFRF
jgi:splicing factor 3B subunit 2